MLIEPIRLASLLSSGERAVLSLEPQERSARHRFVALPALVEDLVILDPGRSMRGSIHG